MTTCAIVGNARSLLLTKSGQEIDGCDIVVRINGDGITDTECQGSRTDVVFVTHHTRNNLCEHHEYDVYDIRGNITEFFDNLTERMSVDLGVPEAYPTTGFTAILYMYAKGVDIKLFGFDWFNTGSLSNSPTNNAPWKLHFPKWEKEYIQHTLHLIDE